MVTFVPPINAPGQEDYKETVTTRRRRTLDQQCAWYPCCGKKVGKCGGNTRKQCRLVRDGIIQRPNEQEIARERRNIRKQQRAQRARERYHRKKRQRDEAFVASEHELDRDIDTVVNEQQNDASEHKLNNDEENEGDQVVTGPQ